MFNSLRIAIRNDYSFPPYNILNYHSRFAQDWWKTEILYGVKKILSLPPFWALALGIVFNLTGISVPSFLSSTMTSLGALLVPLVLLALGAYFEFPQGKAKY